MEATNAQMQNFCDTRIRQRAEALRDVRLRCADDKASLDDEYARATGSNAWADARNDGPPHLLQSGNGANPDDLTNYNAFIVNLEKFFTGTFANVGEANAAAAQWVVLSRACVRTV